MVRFVENEKGDNPDRDASHSKLHTRRSTRLPNPEDFAKLKKKKVSVFTSTQKWWSKPSIKYAFNHPHVTSRLEKLMGSNLVCLTDRDYMQKLQERILEDYAESMDKRIKVREHEEMERVKNLVLNGRIPLNEAPECMADHPIMTIEKICRRLIAQRRAKIKIPKVHIPKHLYYDDTPDPPSGLSIENGHVFRKSFEKLCNPITRFLPDDDTFVYELETEEEMEELEEEVLGAADIEAVVEMTGEEAEEEEEEIIDEYMFPRSEYNKLKYESPLIKRLRKCETVEELYALADEIIGFLKNLDISDRRSKDESRKDRIISVMINESACSSGSSSVASSQQGSVNKEAIS